MPRSSGRSPYNKITYSGGEGYFCTIRRQLRKYGSGGGGGGDVGMRLGESATEKVGREFTRLSAINPENPMATATTGGKIFTAGNG